MSKDNKRAQILIRLSSEDKRSFLKLCNELDTSAAREVRRFIRSFISEHDRKAEQ